MLSLLNKKNLLFNKFKRQPDSIKKRLDNLERLDIDEYQLKVIKKEKVYPEVGEVFAVNPIEGTYLFIVK